jgi:hypothetical protein
MSEVQAEDPEEWQSRKARLYVVSQELPRPSVHEILIAQAGARRRRGRDVSALVQTGRAASDR